MSETRPQQELEPALEDWLLNAVTTLRAKAATNYSSGEQNLAQEAAQIVGVLALTLIESRDLHEFGKVLAGIAYDFEHKLQTHYLHTMSYADYLQTEHWQQKRREAHERANGRCQVCNATTTLNVHHRTYERRGYERPEDLIVLCQSCHQLFHDNGKLETER